MLLQANDGEMLVNDAHLTIIEKLHRLHYSRNYIVVMIL